MKLKRSFQKIYKSINSWLKKSSDNLYDIKQADFKFAKETFCAIVNYNHNENAKKLRDIFSNYYSTTVFDSGSDIKDESFINLPNIYYSGLYNHAYAYAKDKGYKYLLFICSDVEVEKKEAEKMYEHLSLINVEEVGVYSPSSTGRSHYQCNRKNKNGLRIVDFVEGFLFFAQIKMLDNFSPINTELNLLGWGIDVAKGFYSKKMGLLSMVDDGVTIYHPEETKYSVNNAEEQMLHWFSTLQYGNEIINFHENRVQLIRSGFADKLKISVIVPCYNQAQYIKEAVYSVFSQTYSNYEILIINDGSTDNSEDVINALFSQFSQVKYIKQENKGLGATRNVGLDKAEGDFIQFLDADDYISDNKFSTAIQKFVSDKNIDIVYSVYLCFEDGNPAKSWTYSRVELNEDPLFDLITQWENGLSIPVHCLLFKKEIIGNNRFDIQLPNHEDWEFHLSIAAKDPTYSFIENATAFYRIKKTGMSQNPKTMKDGKNRCLANIIASKKIKESYLPALTERFDYKIVIGIITCKKNIEKINVIRDTWVKDLKKLNIPYYFIIGDTELISCKVDGDILYVPCPDTYESLLQKVSCFYKYVFDNTSYDYIYKIDDDCFLNVELLHTSYFWNFDYFGKTVGTDEKDLNRTWHFDKCHTDDYNTKPYEGKYHGSWCGGGYGYFLSRTALKEIVGTKFTTIDLYEDKSIGDALRKRNITPETNLSYTTLDILQFGTKTESEPEFNKLIDQHASNFFTVTVINELSKKSHFLQLQNKKQTTLIDY